MSEKEVSSVCYPERDGTSPIEEKKEVKKPKKAGEKKGK